MHTTTISVPIQVPNYRFQRLLGHGGMARVYLAEQLHPHRDVVIKIVAPEDIRVTNPEIRERVLQRLQHEGDIAARFQHPNLVTVFECGVINEHYYLAMEYLAGGDLRARLDQPLAEDQALAVAAKLARGLEEMHRLGLLHRDLKPENILFRESGEPVLVDFGIAKEQEDRTTLTDLGVRSGTPHYMSPEHLTSAPMDHRSDIYALGVVLFEMLTGRVPYDGNTSLAISRAHLEQPIPGLPDDLAHLQPIIDRLLAKRPEDRYQSAAEVVAALSGGPVPVRPRSAPRRRLHRWHWAAGALVLLALLAVPIGRMLDDDDPSTAALAPATDRKSIAVLPFVNMSNDPDNEYFSDGISEEILNALAQVDALRVAARTSSFQFKGRNENVTDIGAALGVRHVLEGSVRKSGDRVRITAQLIDVETGYHLWSEAYDRRLDDIFAIQDEIARSVADALHLQLLGRAARERSPSSVEAYDLYLLGQHHFHQRNRESLERARTLFEEAIRIDPEFALAQVGLANATILLLHSSTTYGELPLDQVNQTARSALARAQALDPALPEVHASEGLLAIVNGRFDAAVEHLTDALDLNPSYAMAYMWRGTTYGFLARFDRCLADVRQALAIDPLSPAIHANLIWANHLAGDPALTDSYIAGTLERYPDLLLAWGNAGTVRYMQGRLGQAETYYRQAHARSASYRLARDMLGLIALDRGQTEAAAGLLPGSGWPLVAQGRLAQAQAMAQALPEPDHELLTYAAAASGDHAEVARLYDALSAGHDSLPGPLAEGSRIANLGRLPALTVAWSLAALGDAERAEQVRREAAARVEAAWSSGARTAGVHYLRGVLAAMAEDPESAFAHLQQAVESGWRSHWYLQHDPRLEPLQEDARFDALVQQTRQAAAADEPARGD